jgi:flavin-dependent dehydrogenase
MIDLIVAGGGPVGLMTAIRARLAGLDVTVVEQRSGPIDKACGEGLMPDALSALQFVGVDPAGHDFHGIRYISGGNAAQARFRSGPGRGVRRLVLHAAMYERAKELGVEMVTGRVDTITANDGFIEVGDLRARYLVGADGLHSNVRRILGLGEVASGLQRFGIRQHFGIAPWSDLVEVYWLDDSEIYVTPVGGDTVGVAVLGRSVLNLDEAIARVPELSARLDCVPRVSELRGAGPLMQRVSARSADRVMLVGDASGYIDALTGEGLRLGFAEAQAAVNAVLADQVDQYERDWRKVTRSYRLMTGGLLWASSRRSLRPMIVPAARALPKVFNRIVDSLAA